MPPRRAANENRRARRVEDRQDEDLAVAGVPRVTGGVNRIQDAVHFFIMADDFQAHFLRELHAGIFVMFRVRRVVFLAEAAGVGHGHAVDVLSDQSLDDPVQ
jgi:hypothetical protein